MNESEMSAAGSVAAESGGCSGCGAGCVGCGWVLVRAVQAGDRAAFGRLWPVYRPAVARFLAARVADRHLVEDLTSETFARALAGIGSVSPRTADPGAWLVRIARNLVCDHAKRAETRRVQRVADVSEPADVADPAGVAGSTPEVGPEALAVASAQREALAAVLAASMRAAGLSAAQWQVVAASEGWSAPPSVVAARLGVSPAAVKARRHRLLAALRAQLAARGIDCVRDAEGLATPSGGRREVAA